MKPTPELLRNIMMQHCPKKHLDFENPISNPNKVDTFGRILGEKLFNETTTEGGRIGAGKNPSDDLPKIGRKKKDLEAEVSKKMLNGY